MQKYYGVLEVATTATQEEIRSQYKQLVRIYHPDRFINPLDKVYAEEKLKEINEAYSILSNKPQSNAGSSVPKPIVDPLWLDFGVVDGRSKVVRSFQVGNLGGPTKTIEFLYGESNPWFQIGNGRPVTKGMPIPVLFDVTADIQKLAPTQAHHAWVDVDMDGVRARLNLTVRVTKAASLFKFSRHLIFGIVICVIVLLAVLLFQFSVGLPVISNALRSSERAPAVERLQADHLLFSVDQDDQQVVYFSQADGTNQVALGLTGWAPVASPNGRKIAYLSGEKHAPQIFVSDVDGGHFQQVTAGPEPKSNPAWSTDGSMLAFLVGPDSQTVLRIFDVQGNQFYDPPNANLGFVKHFDWSPDDRTILFDAYLGTANRIYQFSPSSQHIQLFTSFDSWDPAWSPDDKRVAVTSQQGIFILNSQGTDLQQLTKGHGWSPAWSFDGRQIAFFSDKNSISGRQNLWVMDSDGGNQIRLPGANSLTFAWSPISQRLAYVTGSAQKQTPILYLWVTDLTSRARLIAEVNQPMITWTR